MRNLSVASKLLLMIVAVAMTGCKSKINYEEEIQGKWICQEIDRYIIPTNDVFTLTLQNGNVTYAKGHTLSGGGQGSSWLESRDLRYQVNDNILSISGTNALGETVDMLLEIEKANSQELIYREKQILINNTDLSSGRLCELYKSQVDHIQEIYGKWELRLLSGEDSLSAPLHLYEFGHDHTFTIYTGNNGNWIPDENINGSFHIYGNIIVLDMHYLSSGNHQYQCYILNETGSRKMVWRQWYRMPGTAHDLQGVRYELRLYQ